MHRTSYFMDLLVNLSRLHDISYFCLIVLQDYGVDKYDIGAGFGHFGIAVEDVSSNV